MQCAAALMLGVGAGQAAGEATYTAANGDAVSFAWADVPITALPGPVISFDGDMTVTGGTGRFVQPSGVIHFSGGFDVRTGIGWVDHSGAISW